MDSRTPVLDTPAKPEAVEAPPRPRRAPRHAPRDGAGPIYDFSTPSLGARLRSDRVANTAVLLLVLLALTAAVAPLLSPHDTTRSDFSRQYEAPSLTHPFGTDDLGRDLFTRVMLGGRLTLSIAAVAVLLGLLVGVAAGAVAGYAGGWVDTVIMRCTDLVLSVPIFFIILLASSITTPGFVSLCALVAATLWMEMARVVRSVVMTTRERDFVEAARALGASEKRVLLRHVLRHASGPVAVAATLGFAQAISLESALSFLGYGVQPPTPSWGAMLQSAKGVLGVAPWMAFFPGAMIFVAVLSAYVLGDFLRTRESRRSASEGCV